MHTGQVVDGKRLLDEAVRQRNGTGLFYLFGVNEYVSRVVEHLRRETLDPTVRDLPLNLHELDATDLKREDLEDEFRLAPIASPRRVAVIKNANRLSEEARKGFRGYPKLMPELLMVLISPPHTYKDEELASIEGIILVECL